jgi:hypothetical protein
LNLAEVYVTPYDNNAGCPSYTVSVRYQPKGGSHRGTRFAVFLGGFAEPFPKEWLFVPEDHLAKEQPDDQSHRPIPPASTPRPRNWARPIPDAPEAASDQIPAGKSARSGSVSVSNWLRFTDIGWVFPSDDGMCNLPI